MTNEFGHDIGLREKTNHSLSIVDNWNARDAPEWKMGVTVGLSIDSLIEEHVDSVAAGRLVRQLQRSKINKAFYRNQGSTHRENVGPSADFGLGQRPLLHVGTEFQFGIILQREGRLSPG